MDTNVATLVLGVYPGKSVYFSDSRVQFGLSKDGERYEAKVYGLNIRPQVRIELFTDRFTSVLPGVWVKVEPELNSFKQLSLVIRVRRHIEVLRQRVWRRVNVDPSSEKVRPEW